jgi:hypothetical protein
MLRSIVGYAFCFGCVGFFGWSLFHCLRKGEAGPQSELGGLLAKRAEHPLRFWSFIAIYVGATLLFAAGGMFGSTGPASPSSLQWLAAAAAGWSIMFSAAAFITGIYTRDGFRTGRAVFFGQVRMSFSDRVGHPGEFWTSQITSIGLTVFCAAIGLFPWAFVLWISAGSPTLW